ncbi:MAG: hypothetical protein Q9P01_17540 [Anaerolineae bacterium]|nr:hypothetical protein [Anaerolineae bacterium]MDQ7036560.1 hypothetical protein [Anaerolineae bacterium]
MMNRSPKQLALIGLAIMLATFFIIYFMGYGFPVAVMMLIASSSALIILTVMVIGSTHGDSPVAASDSEAVAIWNERLSSKQAKARSDEADTESSE